MLPLTLVIGALYGDEGKGRVVHALAREFSVVTRATGGANASHTCFHRGTKITLRQVPCGVLAGPRVWCTTGDGMVLDPLALVDELKMLESHGIPTTRVRVAERAFVVTPLHKIVDGAREERSLGEDDDDDEGGNVALGTTRQGVGPALVDKVMRTALRFSDLGDVKRVRRSLEATAALFPSHDPGEAARKRMATSLVNAGKALASRIADTREIVHDALARGRDVLVEGAQGTLLDVDHGAWPHVTSTHPTTAGALASLGVGPREVEHVVGVVRAYATRQARGAFPTEVTLDEERAFRSATREHVLRVGWLDAVALRMAARLNGFTELIVTSLDRVASLPKVKVATAYVDDEGRSRRVWLRPERAPANVRYVEVIPDQVATAKRVGPITTRTLLGRLRSEVDVPIRRVSTSPSGPLLAVEGG